MIIIRLNGRLGNQMFQYVICRLVSEKLNTSFHIEQGWLNDERPDWVGYNLFDLDMGVNECIIKHKWQEPSMGYNENVFNVDDYTEIIGYFQSDKYYKGNEFKVKEWFEIKYESDYVNNILNQYPVDEFCYIHFRGGDYKNNRAMLPLKYYNDAKNEMCMKCVIVTDDITFAKQYFINDIIISSTLEDDFSILTNSKYMILSASSFSWWSAWLKDKKKVIGPKGWYNYNFNKKFLPEDIKFKNTIYL